MNDDEVTDLWNTCIIEAGEETELANWEYTLDLTRFDTRNVTNMQTMFQNSRELISIKVSRNKWVNNSGCSTINMFAYCYSMTSLDLSKYNWSTSNVTNMDYMFAFCNNLKTINLRGLYTLNLNIMNSMFRGCISLEEITGIECIDTDKVTDMSFMFKDCRRLQVLYLNSWNTCNVDSMVRMFENCESLILLDIRNFEYKDTCDTSYILSGANTDVEVITEKNILAIRKDVKLWKKERVTN